MLGSLANIRKRLENFERNHRQSPPKDSPELPGSRSTSEQPNEQANPPTLPEPRGSLSSPNQHQNRNQSQDQVALQPSTVRPRDGEVTNQTVSPPGDGSTDDADVSNLLVPEQPSYMSDYSGRLRFLGHSSTWSFSHQVLQMASQGTGLSCSPAASMQRHVDGQTYSIDSQRRVDLGTIETTGLPSLELAVYYLQSTKFRTYPFFHLFEETDFMQNLHLFYRNPQVYARTHSLWYVHYLLIMGFGKSFVRQQATVGPAGSDLFARAMAQMPDATYLCRDPVKATEILCCVALYLHCVDHRVAAHSYIGQAVRMAQSHGLHTNMQSSSVGNRLAQHGDRLWWTAYTLDQKLSSLMGMPSGILDDHISAPLPQVSENDIHISALAIHIKISQLLGSIAITVYGPKATVKETFLSTVRKVLKGIAELSEDLAAVASRSFGEISRVSAHLDLQYNQCIVLTVRPLLFHLYKQKVEALGVNGEFNMHPSIMELIEVLTSSTVRVANILSQLKKHGLLDILLPFDLEAAYSAAFVLVMASEVGAKHSMHEVSLAALFEVFDNMIMAGNLLASSRKTEVEELAYSLRKQFHPGFNTDDSASGPVMSDQPCDATFASQFGLPSAGGTFFDEWIPENSYPNSQLIGLADSLTMDELHELWV
ncbi:hypothetical protein KAF25_011091 [Fusarium avenaceum]|uniref:Xylanolytic transcriptional activator regulatory domain-containing protein n=1 Tax=Fusarium avenaceum TaxID=40199 RepID=A0A9P7H201_9HYPO|nr:hypothetical protein KAF25_011091 [Fusarium avenaceum]